HMSFNGTKRFPKSAIIDYLQSIGMRFGADLNAYTNQGETIYQLEVPTDKPEFVGKGLDILRDWAGDATYDDKEVKAESGVVLEEWRGDRGADMRLELKHNKVLFKGTRWADHDVIGDPEILKKADRSALYRFYKDWYRPDNMAVIAVGDFEPADLEKLIPAKFSDLKNPAKERAKVKGGIPKADGTRISIETDKELPTAEVSIHNYVPARSKATLPDLKRIITEQLYQQVMSERFAALRRRPDAPFLNAFSGMIGANRETDDFIRNAAAKNGKLEDALRVVLTEAARVERHGITQTELDRAKVVISRNLDQIVDQHKTLDSRALVQEIVRNFLTGEFIVAPEEERDLSKKMLATVTVQDINADTKTFGGADNRAIEISVPDGQPKPTADKVKQIISDVEKADIPAWEEKAIPTALMTTPPKPGKIVKEKTYEKIGVYEWTLSNGAHVILKPTDFEQDAVTMLGDSPGGNALTADYTNARFAPQVAAIGGVGEFDADTLGKVLAGKTVNVNLNIGETTEGLSASASPKDLETMFQLTYLRFTAVRKDVDQFKLWQANSAESLANQDRNPEFQFFKQSRAAEYKDNPRRSFPKPEEFAKVDLDKSLAFYKARIGDVADWNFVIVGEIDLAKIRPMVETYLASLPAKGRHEKEKDLGIRKVPGVVKKEFALGIEPKATVQFDFHADDKWSMDAERDLYVLGQAVSNLLRENLREDKGGTYGVGAFGSLARTPHQERGFIIQFGCAPERVDELVTAMNEELAKLQKDGPSDELLDKIRQIYTRTRETELRTNRFWAQRLVNSFHFGDDPNDIADMSKTLGRIKKENVVAAAKHYLDPKTMYVAVRKPVAATK
ncbi:MAG: insulinase family protein, partial [Kofleriaceae bacterium]